MNTLKDLNKHLFDQLNRLAETDKKDLDGEIARSKAICEVSTQIVDTHKTQLEAAKLITQYKGMSPDQKPVLIEQVVIDG